MLVCIGSAEDQMKRGM